MTQISQILMNDRHFGYITKSLKKTLVGRQLASYLPQS
jgi:hypothetical protein